MSILQGLWVRFRALLFRERVEEELDDEIRFHLDMATEQLLRRSVSPDEARRRALLEFGGVERFKEKTRDARIFNSNPSFRSLVSSFFSHTDKVYVSFL